MLAHEIRVDSDWQSSLLSDFKITTVYLSQRHWYFLDFELASNFYQG